MNILGFVSNTASAATLLTIVTAQKQQQTTRKQECSDKTLLMETRIGSDLAHEAHFANPCSMPCRRIHKSPNSFHSTSYTPSNIPFPIAQSSSPSCHHLHPELIQAPLHSFLSILNSMLNPETGALAKPQSKSCHSPTENCDSAASQWP